MVRARRLAGERKPPRAEREGAPSHGDCASMTNSSLPPPPSAGNARDRLEDVMLHVNMARAFAHGDELGDRVALARVLVSLSDAVSLLAEVVREGARR